MAEQTFRSPGFFETEVDVTPKRVLPSGTPAGVIGTAEFGPAFVPVTVGSMDDFRSKFGKEHPDRFGPYAVSRLLALGRKKSLTYVRVLGAGANDSDADISLTKTAGIVKNAGFVLSGANRPADPTHFQHAEAGSVQFLVASHNLQSEEVAAYPIFTDNDSVIQPAVQGTGANLVRGVLFTATGSFFRVTEPNADVAAVLDGTSNIYNTAALSASLGSVSGTPLSDSKYFKLHLSSSAGAIFGQDSGLKGLRSFTVSLDPSDNNYISKVLNTDPHKFQEAQHLLYSDFSVEHEVAQADKVAILSGSTLTPKVGGLSDRPFSELYGRYDTRYSTPKTTKFISQPYGSKEFELFHFETISDGAYANSEFKVSIANLRASTDEANPYGTFDVYVRKFADTDKDLQILERFAGCNLNPASDDFVAKKVGDYKVYFDFDQSDSDERRLVVSGRYPNMSSLVRIVMAESVYDDEVPSDALPFGFRGLPVLKLSESLTDHSGSALASNGRTLGNASVSPTAPLRLSRVGTHAGDVDTEDFLSSPIVPPVPMRFKVTRGATAASLGAGDHVGKSGTDERVDASYFWGVKTSRLPRSADLGSNAAAVRQSNAGSGINPLIKSLTKFQGLEKVDVLVTGSACDAHNNNKFTLARVAFSNQGTSLEDIFTQVTGSAKEHMLEAAYIRNAVPDHGTYTVDDRTGTNPNRFTLASLLATSSIVFNRFTNFAKFTNIFYGGFDGVNILDKDQTFFLDRAMSADSGGKAVSDSSDIGLALINSKNQSGAGRLNNNIASVNKAVDIITDPTATRINILAIPGVREPFVTDHALQKTKDYSQAIYIMDTVVYDENKKRLYDDSLERPDVRETSELFESRAVDNNYGATFFPDVFMNDTMNNQVVRVPASVAAVSALALNDSVRKPWFAPAGFSRGSLDFVSNVHVRLSSDDRDVLYDARINPIAVFPRTGFVIFGQKTLQMAKSALDRINVRRLMLEIKRLVSAVALNLLFEPNNATTRGRFISKVVPLLALIQADSGIESFKVVMDDSNNTKEDIDSNRLNGRIIVVPTRAVEFISVDFVISNNGVDFL